VQLPETLEDLLRILKAGNVLVYKQGDLLLQFSPELPRFDEPPDPSPNVIGGWKRGPDLDVD
jgi:hypothetical protein